MPSPRFLFLLFAVFLVSTLPVRAQDIGIDWSTKTLTSYPSKVQHTMTVNVKVTKVNELLYDYKIDITAIPQSQDDFGKIAALLLKPGASASVTAPVGACQTALETAKTALRDVSSEITKKNTSINPDTGSGSISSVSRDKTVNYWRSTVQPKDDAVKAAMVALRGAISSGGCPSADVTAATDFLVNTYATYRVPADDFESRMDNPREIAVLVTLSPQNDYKVVVTESYKGKATDGGTQTFTFSPESDILTLSAGTLLTEIQNRTYTSGTIPGQTGNVLIVGGRSPIRPILVAQLNYRIPYLSRDEFGLATSSGLALQFTGGNSGVSNVGFFGGLSVHLWRRLYLTPGVHVGEFADFPAGFSAPNQPIPTGFGQLNPVKRWTVRFAFGISYKAVDFSQFTGGSKQQSPSTAKQ
jgi:hypothetical protein